MKTTSQNFSYYVGIDWATTHHVIHGEDPTGQKVLDFQIEESLSGYAELDRRLASLEVPPQQVAMALETPHGLLLEPFCKNPPEISHCNSPSTAT